MRQIGLSRPWDPEQLPRKWTDRRLHARGKRCSTNLDLGRRFSAPHQAIEPLVMISQLAASYFACWQSSRLAADLEWEAKTAAAILDLVGKIHEAAT